MSVQRVDRVMLVTRLLEKWGLSQDEKEKILGCLAATEEASSSEHLDLLLSLHRNLRILFPSNPEISNSWVRRGNGLIGGEQPLSIMLREGVSGIRKMLALTNDLLMR